MEQIFLGKCEEQLNFILRLMGLYYRQRELLFVKYITCYGSFEEGDMKGLNGLSVSSIKNSE